MTSNTATTAKKCAVLLVILSKKYKDVLVPTLGIVLRNTFSRMQPCKINSENWTYFRFHFQRVSFRSLIVELATILDKTQVWPRKSILYVQISQTWITKYF